MSRTSVILTAMFTTGMIASLVFDGNYAWASTGRDNTATAISLPVTAITPPVTAITPSVTAITPPVTAITPPVTAITPSVTAITPSVTAITPPVTAITPPVTAITPPVTAITPSVTAITPPVTAITPPVTAIPPPVTVITPPVTAITPSVTAITPPVTAITPPVTAIPPPVTAITPPVTAITPSVTAITPPVTAITPSVTVITTPVTVITTPEPVFTPLVTAITPREPVITPPEPVFTPLVTAITPPEPIITPPEPVFTPLVTAITPPEPIITPPVNAYPSFGTSDPRGVRTHVDGDRVVFEVNSDYLSDCIKRTMESETMGTPVVFLNTYWTSHFQRGTLKMDFRLDYETGDLLYKTCRIALMTRSRRYVSIKTSHLEASPINSCELYFDGKMTMGPASFNTNLERPRLSIYEGDSIDLTFSWSAFPMTFSMDLHYDTEMDNWNAGLLEVTSTAPKQGFARSPFWDGLTQLRDGDDFLNEYASIEDHLLNEYASLVDHRDHITMISWERIGISDSKHCTGAKVSLSTQFYALEYCSGGTPSPSLRNVTYVMLSSMHSLGVYTGVSMRFSFHNASARPHQLADETWNCSVAHWPDFKQHLLCNLLTECAGGEDEADCPYTGGTCPRGYLAAGGSCFTFNLNHGALMTWNEAEAACRRRGARLPTLNTPSKWQAVLDLLSHRGWEKIYIGLSLGEPSLPDLYSGFLQWSDSSVAYYIKAHIISDTKCDLCGFLRNDRRPDFVYLDGCSTKVAGDLMCELDGPSSRHAIGLATENKPHSRINTTRCPKGHVTHNFLSCDPRSDCFLDCQSPSSAPMTSVPPAFKCHNGFERVPFTLVCDHREDCNDGSDEICVFPPCHEFECNNRQCVAHHKKCNRVKDCLDGSDETSCSMPLTDFTLVNFSKPLPAMVLHDGKGEYELWDIASSSAQSTSSHTLPSTEVCPDSHFQCPGVSYYCLPVYVRCNGVRDCPGHEDEVDCDLFQCPGFYRCRRSIICLHDDYLCDGIFQCPQRDDELMCGVVCPAGCTCYGLAFFCAVPFDASRHVGLRFLDASSSGMSLKALSNNTMLFYLSLSMCNIPQLETIHCLNLIHLDLSDNSIRTLTENHISSCQNLQYFDLARNPLRTILENSSLVPGASFSKLHTLDLSAVSISAAEMVMNLSMFSNVRDLNLSNNGLDAVSGFHVFSRLRVLDLRGCPVTYFTHSIFQGLDDLSTLYADNYKLCCPETLPDGFHVSNCHAPFDEVSSCEGLLKSGLYRVSLSVLTSVTLLGNAGSFVYRVVINRPKEQSSFSIFVTNLCMSDFLMGLYSAIIGVADRLYLGNYVWNDVTWRRSVTCKIAGILSLMSNEVSVLIICLITVDRFLVTRFPLSRHLHFSLRSAQVACVTAWSVGILLAVTPLLPVTSHWQFYSQSGICIPLPVTRRWFAGRQYSFGILIILNSALFLVIAIGKISIYLSVRANSMAASDTTQKAKDLTVARRLLSVVVSDFLCWFPVGILGMLSSTGQPIPSEANVFIAVCVLPLNSAINPFLYTVNVILERRERAREQRLQKILLSRAPPGVALAK